MPAISQAQQRAMAIAKHSPGKLYKSNQGMLGMSREQLNEYARTKRKKLPLKKRMLE